MDRLVFLPEANSYSFLEPASTLKSKINAPISLYAQKTLGQSRVVNCSWILTLDEYLDFFNFYKEKSEAVESFLIELIIDTFALEDYKAKFVQSSFSITEQKGYTITIAINLEVLKV